MLGNKGCFSQTWVVCKVSLVYLALRKTTKEPKCADYTVKPCTAPEEWRNKATRWFFLSFLGRLNCFLLGEQRTECYFSIIFFVTYKKNNKAL